MSDRQDGRFKDKTVLVTGATSGIGRETALAFAREGAQVAITGRRKAEGEQVLGELAALGASAVFYPSDVSQEGQVKQVVDKTVERFGKIDVAFNNAGVEGQWSPVAEQTEANYRQVFDINVLGVLTSMKHEITAMSQNGGGAIVNTSSIAGLVGMAGGSVYFASKHAVEGMTKCAALETGTANIRVNSVCPGFVDTDMATRVVGDDEEAKAQAAADQPIPRFGKVDEIADAVLFLASDEARYITGQHLVVDGGRIVP